MGASVRIGPPARGLQGDFCGQKLRLGPRVLLASAVFAALSCGADHSGTRPWEPGAAGEAPVCDSASEAGADNTVTGCVYVDSDRDGVHDAQEVGVPGAVVVWERETFAVADATGRYSLEAPDQQGVVWVRVEAGFEPGPVWVHVDVSAHRSVDLGLRPQQSEDNLTFAVASDTHAGLEFLPVEDQVLVLEQIEGTSPAPRFVAVAGDLTQGGAPAHFELVLTAAQTVAVPYVPIPGNHDLYDGGATYREFLGPRAYAFVADDVDFLVLDDSRDVVEQAGFFLDGLPRSGNSERVIAFMHAPPEEEIVEALSSLGVTTLFTGHQHANRVLVHDSMVEYNTQPLAMAGIDATPAGFRVVTARRGEPLSVRHRTIVDEPVAVAVSPRDGELLNGCNVPILAAFAAGGDILRAYAEVDDREVELTHAGGWTYKGELADACPETSSFEISVRADTTRGTIQSAANEVRIQRHRLYRGAQADWPMVQGGPTHSGASAHEIRPPLRRIWAASVGGHIQGGAPVVVAGRVFVPVIDYADSENGGIVCLDLATGEELWRTTTGFPVRNSPAVAVGIVVVAVNDGTVLGLDVDTGSVVWDYQLAAHVSPVLHNIYSAPTIEAGIAFVGVNRELVAIDVPTGALLWSVEPYDYGGMGSSYASPAVAGGVVVDSFGRGLDGLMAWAGASGEKLWATSGSVSAHLNAPPVVGDGVVYAVNELVGVHAIDLHTGEARWAHTYSNQGFSWAFGVMAPMALADGRLFIPTQYGVLHAVDAATGAELWRYEVDAAGAVRSVHYKGQVPAFTSAAVVTGAVVWVAEASGRLDALSATSGALLWSVDFCVPVLAGPTPAGDYLLVATYDGTVHALAASDTSLPEVSCFAGSAE